MKSVTSLVCFYDLLFVCLLISIKVVNSMDIAKNEVDTLVEEEITKKLSDDLVQSIERKFQVDLEKAVDMVLVKIKLLLQNGTSHIQDRLLQLQELMDVLKKDSESVVDSCLSDRQNETTTLAEKALHQMVVCGYALIGHDPAQAVRNVVKMKNIIRQGVKPIYEQKRDIHQLMKVCGHEHDSLKKVVKCVISKSPLVKSVMMDLTGKLIEGIVGLTKLMAHGAMHEACLIEVIKSIEDEAFDLIEDVKACTLHSGNGVEEVERYMKEDNATVLDVPSKEKIGEKNTNDVTNLIRRMLTEGNDNLIDNTIQERAEHYKKRHEILND